MDCAEGGESAHHGNSFEYGKSAGGRSRRVSQKSVHAVKYVTALEKSAKHLTVKGMQPFSANLEGVVAPNHRDTVTDLSSP